MSEVHRRIDEHSQTRRRGLTPDHKGRLVFREKTFNVPADCAHLIQPEALFKFVEEGDLYTIQKLLESDDVRTTFAHSGAYHRDVPDLVIAVLGMYNLLRELGLTRQTTQVDEFAETLEPDALYIERYAFLMNAMHVANRDWTRKYNKGVRTAKQSESARKTRLKKKMNTLATKKGK
jgi:hypothetical protein